MSNLPMSRNSKQLQRLVLVLIFTVLGCLIGVFAVIDLKQISKEERDKLATQASLVSTNLQLHMRSANLVLEETVALLDFSSLAQQHDRMQSLVNAMPMIRGIGVLDSQGVQIVGTRNSAVGIDFSDRPYFRNVQAMPQRQRLYISTPFQGLNGDTTIALSKAILNADNRLQGVAFAVLDPGYLEMLMSSTLYTPDMWVALRHVDSSDALRVGALPSGDGTWVMSNEELRERLPSLMQEGPATFRRQRDNHDHILSVVLISGYAGNADRPLMVVAGRSHAEAMATWLRLTYIQASLFLLFALAAGAGLLFYQRRRQQYDARRTADEQRMRVQEHDYRLIVERTADCVVRLDLHGSYSYANPAYCALFGMPPQRTPDSSFFDIVAPEDLALARSKLQLTLDELTEQRFQLRCLTPHGVRHMEWTFDSVQADENKIAGLIGVGRDVTAHIAAHDELRNRAQHDSLTGLVNRGHFLDIASASVDHAHLYQQPLAILMLDLDHFKKINDSWGHHGGDVALQTSAHTLRQQCREMDVAARIGGEEFTLLLHGSAVNEAALVAERVRLALAAQTVVLKDGRSFQLTASIGAACLLPGEELESLMQRADMALYQAKEAGRNRVKLANDTREGC